MALIDFVTLEVPNPAAAEAYYAAAFGLGDRLRVCHSESPTTGFH